jgi:hypothetical protein
VGAEESWDGYDSIIWDCVHKIQEFFPSRSLEDDIAVSIERIAILYLIKKLCKSI